MSRAGTKRHCVLISINNSSSIQVNKSMAFRFDHFGDILGAFPASVMFWSIASWVFYFRISIDYVNIVLIIAKDNQVYIMDG